ncbi:MAG: hypoxanthine-guanine phosphoribosyltransferase [Pseudoxanthomonas sp.]|jgi:hypoxanthine phosphoribosyltransferase|nr:hypoxanthine-guanine phosphoribosyltransferase [Pseudoxanthomonas sp.]TXI32941.1 MAG: hypoxanthine-guanine phosphoribosyltransferase [Ottowia sp.]MBP8741063.1 hypoxanthine-guanine phosphoribosyltransferase [Pseudoxanthomonas sp.]MBP8803126.1 hypoxanthine-guanine phosphoribosyltransferase [Pseudoxanthomonas sp.]MBP8908966.1 hypoxanthine-guanine phosphoribosyltransferase [Pseudoxanthomonas sp.]
MPDLLIAEALEQSDLIYDRAAIDAAIAGMADAIAADYIGQVPANRMGDSFVPVFLTVMHGALPFAGQLALELGARGLDLQFDYLHATRYRGSNQGGELVWKHRPATALYGRRVLIADDILDEGHTLAEVRRWCIEQGATDVRIAAMTVKDHDRCVAGIRADYVGLHLPDRYVYGFGMDYHEQGRNLPAIYALKA